MKIAYIIPKLKDSGLTRIPFWLSKFFYPANEVKVFYFSDTHPQDKLLDFEVPVQKISFTGFCKDLNNYEIIHSHGFKPDVYVALNYDKINGVKITTIHGYHEEELSFQRNKIFGWILGNLWDYYCSKLDVIVCITKTMREYYYQRLKSTKITFIYNGINYLSTPIDYKKISFTDTEKAQKIKLVTVSSLNSRKGVDQIIKVLEKNTRFYFTGIGGNDNDIFQLRELSKTLGVDERCKFLSFRDNPWEITVENDVFIFPSRSEGCPLSLVEAASLAIPIICSDIPTFREMFDEDEVTFFQLDNIDDLNQKIIDLPNIKNKVYKAKLRMKEKFDMSVMCDSYSQLYKKYVR